MDSRGVRGAKRQSGYKQKFHTQVCGPTIVLTLYEKTKA